MENFTSDFLLAYTDACPSELIHNSSEDFLCVGFVYYFHIYKNKLIKINQFKNVRGIDRKLSTQKYIIENIENGLINPVGYVKWNYKQIALENGKFILEDSMLISDIISDDEIVKLGDFNVKYGQAVSLAGYSLILASFLMEIGKFSRVFGKKKAAILLDLLPGDNAEKFRNIHIVQYIIENSKLVEFHNDAVEINNLDVLGYGNGSIHGDTKKMKNGFEYTITDWIIQSFNSLLKYEMHNLDKSSNEFKLSELAKYLVNKGVFKISSAQKLIE